jgi:hypothetical protein
MEIINSQSSGWYRSSGQTSINAADATFVFPSGTGQVGLWDKTTYGTITKVQYWSSSTTVCGSGQQPIIWGHDAHLFSTAHIEANCEVP